MVLAGVLCAIVSHPADTVVSKLNQAKGSTAVSIAKQLGWWGMCCKTDIVQNIITFFHEYEQLNVKFIALLVLEPSKTIFNLF